MMSKTIWQSISNNLKVRQDHNIILTWEKDDELNSTMALLKGKEMAFKAF